MSSIVENLKEIAGSLPEGVKLVAVSKTKPVEAIEEAYRQGREYSGKTGYRNWRRSTRYFPKI